MRFKILTGSVDHVESSIQAAINRGWALHGDLKILVLPNGVCDPGVEQCWTNGDDEVWAFQAIVHPDDNASAEDL